MNDANAAQERGRQRNAPLLAACAIIALAWLVLARVLGPSDLWDNSQPKTISYTTDMIVHGAWAGAEGGEAGRWVLPMERGVLYATKPPLYNWLAAPFVMWLGFDSEIAHKLPSVIALCACWLLVVRLGRWLGDPRLGWLAGIALVANAAIFKLGYLARPDMLLTLWITLAWAAATAAMTNYELRITNRTADASPQFPFVIRHSSFVIPIAFWLCIALAGLTKGPPALVGVIAALVSAKLLTGSWRAFAALRPLAGLTACALIVGLWVYGVWRLQPQHLWEGLWFNEIAGRISGLGPEGAGEGPIALVSDLPIPFLYYLARFAPWSLAAIAGGVAVARLRWQMRHQVEDPWWRGIEASRQQDQDRESLGIAMPGCPATADLRLDASVPRCLTPWMLSAAAWAATALAIFTFSAGKRADYIAIVIPSSSLLAAWWILRSASAVRWANCLAAALMLAGLTWRNELEQTAPVRDFGDATMHFVHEATAAMGAEPLPLAFWWADDNHLQALLGASQPDGRDAVMDLVRDGQPLWVVAGRRRYEPFTFDAWLNQRPRLGRGGRGGTGRGGSWQAEAVAQTPLMPRTDHWPGQVTLYRVTPPLFKDETARLR